MPSSSRSWKSFTAKYLAFANAEKKSLERLMRQSDAMLGPNFREPLRSNLMIEDVLSEAREEAYSAALGWSLGQLSIGQVIDVLNIQDLNFRGNRWRQSTEWLYDNEADVPEGHDGQAGRVDMTITFGKQFVAAIEIKTTEYAEYDTEKHIGYVKSIARKANRSNVDMIFIAVQDLEIELHGFRFMSWLDVTAGLRKYAPYVIKNKGYTIAAIYLAFIGAVEENLMGFGAPGEVTHAVAVSQANHLRTVLTNDPS